MTDSVNTCCSSNIFFLNLFRKASYILPKNCAGCMRPVLLPLICHCLPAMDPYIMGYKIRRRFIDEAFYDYVFDRFGNASPVIVLNGAIIGVWDVADDKNLVKFFLFNQMQDDIYEKVIETGISVGRFYCEREVDIMEVRSMIPVKKLTAGSFMSPLKNMPGE